MSATARRAGVSVRQLLRIRAGEGDVRLSTVERVAQALGEHPLELMGGAPRRKRAAPIGRKRGRPRGLRREPNAGEPDTLDVDPDDAVRDEEG